MATPGCRPLAGRENGTRGSVAIVRVQGGDQRWRRCHGPPASPPSQGEIRSDSMVDRSRRASRSRGSAPARVRPESTRHSLSTRGPCYSKKRRETGGRQVAGSPAGSRHGGAVRSIDWRCKPTRDSRRLTRTPPKPPSALPRNIRPAIPSLAWICQLTPGLSAPCRIRHHFRSRGLPSAPLSAARPAVPSPTPSTRCAWPCP